MSDEDAQHHATFVHEGERRFIYAHGVTANVGSCYFPKVQPRPNGHRRRAS